MNITCLKSHIEGLRQYLHAGPSYHLFGVAESWLANSVSDSVIEVDGYSVLRQDRNENIGGVALYVRNDFKVTVLAFSNTSGPGKTGVPEFLMWSILLGDSSPILVCVIYRPPHVSFLGKSDLLDSLRSFCSDFSHKIIMGDFNADLMSDSDDDKLPNPLYQNVAHLDRCNTYRR